ncbi:MAG: amino acid adenylation domain-containing protein, partial [Cyanobacteria bacterium P01_H01_bin.150]
MDNFEREIAALSPEQRMIFEKRRKQKRLNKERTQEISKIKIPKRKSSTEEIPLSFAQQRLWFFQQLNPDNSTYNNFNALRLKGQINITLLEKVFTEIVRRHESLRTTFTTNSEGLPIQVIASIQPFKILIADLEDIPDRNEEFEKLATKEAQKSFNLTQPLLRITLLKLAEADYVLLITIHHIISDRWSMGIFVREMKVLYEFLSKKQFSYVNTGKTPLSELPIQYADWTIWQKKYLQEKVLQVQTDYWTKQLANLPVLKLPTDRLRPAVATYRGAKQSFELSKTLSDALKTLSVKEGITLFTLLLTVFKVLLYKYTNQNDIVVGTDIANRNRVETEGLIGFLINTLVLRTDLSGNPTFTQLLSRVREVTIKAYDHQDLSFDKLVDILKPERNLSEMVPLFQVKFDLQLAKVEPVELSDLTVNSLDFDNGTAKFELRFNLLETDRGLAGLVEYSTDIFDSNTITRMVGHYRNLLERIVANPQQRLSDLSLLTEAEKHQLLWDQNNIKVDYSADKCIHELFEAQVEKTPLSVALVFEDQQLTYWELNARANQLAHHLRSLGVKPEVLVGICVERSLDTVIGLLAILKAGGAYVPLDPEYPSERLAFALQDTQLRVLLTQQHLVENLPQHQTNIICIDTDWESIAQQSSQNPISECTTDNLAYIIYTSGSTGQPKGVLVNHSNVVRLLAATESWYNFNQNDVFSFFHSICFDFSVWEIWGALLYGGQLVVVPYMISRSPQDFYKLLLTKQVTILNQTPSAFRQLIHVEESLGKSHNLSLRKVIFGGEALQIEGLRPWFERHEDQFPQLVNMYGITETTVHVTYRPLTKADLELASESLIGRAIPDLQVYLLDSYGQLVPIGVPGEMYVGGAGVARGYLNRPTLTSQRFIPNCFSSKPNARLYKTGDLGRYLPNGDIEYLGRIDHQVKVRGFRIELGEIEAVISQYPAVREVVVIVREDSVGFQRIVAYVVAQREQTLAISELRDFLESRLPNYMVPAAFVTLEALPLTPNGKVGRKALPAPDNMRPELEEVFVEPSIKEEKILAKIWAEVLGLERVGIHDNFFSLGGDSIRSIQVQSQAQKYDLSFSIQKLFQFQTIYELAKNLTNIKQSETSEIHVQQVEPFTLLSEEDRKKLPNDLEDAYPLSQLQAGMLFHSVYSPDTAIFHNVTSLHLKAPFDSQKLQIAIQELAAFHPILRTSFDLENYSEPIQLVHRNISIPLQIEDLRHLCTTEQENVLGVWFEEEKSQKFNWKCPPLLRFQIHCRSEDTFQFSFTEHHAILDGWSVASMLTELFERYLSLLGEKITLADSSPRSAYRDFIVLEREALKSDKCLRYWHQKLHDSTVTTIPRLLSCDQIRNISRSVAEHNVELSLDVSRGLKKLTQITRVPLKSILLAAHLKVLSLLSNQADVVTGLVSNGRLEEADGQRTLGLFLNTLPFRLQLSGGSWLDLIQTTFDTERELLPYRRYPLAELQRVLSRQLLFEVGFNFTNFHVYQDVARLNKVQLLSSKSLAEADFALFTQFSLDEFSSKIYLKLQYDVNEFSSEQIEAIGNYYDRTLVAIVTEPKKSYESTSVLSPQEQHQLLEEWNNTEVEYPPLCIHELFEAQVEKTPDAIAVVFEDQELTYRELNQWANQLAHYLQSLEVGSGVLVGICFEPSLEQVVSLLAVLKANGVYVPLDPNYPQERLSFMLENSNVHTLLTQESLSEKISSQNAHIVCLDRDGDAIGKESVENLNLQTTPDDLAYAIYTSGSTGKPKAVLGKIRGIINRLHWMWETLPFGVSEVCIQKTSINFVDHVAEIFSPLLKGIPLVVVPDNIRSDVLRLMSLLSDKKITRIVVVPSLLKAMLDTTSEELTKLQYLKYVFCSGEALPLKLAESFHQKLSSARLFNLYGSSEVSADVTCYEVNFRETRQRILQYFKPQVVREQTENQVLGVDQKSFTKPGVSAEMLATQFQRSELPSYPLTVDDYNDKLS